MSYVFVGFYRFFNIITQTYEYIFFFSHEGVGGILMWGFWNKAHWKPDAAIVDGDDLVPNLAGEAYMRQEF